jgi:hypothetical protein
MSKELLMPARLRNVVAACGVAALVVVSSSSAGAVSSAPVSGGPLGQGACAAPALAARTGGTVLTLRAFGDCEIGRRQSTLADLTSVVDGSSALTTSDRAELAAAITTESSGLASFQTTIDGQARLPALKVEIVQIDTRFRVYLLVAPKVYLVSAADGVLALQQSFTQTAADLAERIATAEADGKDVTAAKTSLDSMNAEVAAAMNLAAPLPGKLLPLTAAQWNSGNAGPVVSAARAALVSARSHLQAAVRLGRAVIVALQ